jgi:hypothetical protein
MRRPAVIAIRVSYVLLITLAVCILAPALRRAKSYSGPGPRGTIFYNLESIDEAKAILKESKQLPDDYWPTRAEIASAYTGESNTSFDTLFKRTRWGEIYIVNQIGAPAYAYLSNAVSAVAGLPEGVLLTAQDLKLKTQPSGATNGSQPIRAETNGTSPATGFRR